MAYGEKRRHQYFKVKILKKMNSSNDKEPIKPTLNKGVVMRSRLSPGDKLICWAKGAAYGDTFTVQDPMYDDGMILQCDKYGFWTSLKDVDLTEFDYT